MTYICTKRVAAAAGAHLILVAIPVLASTGCGPSISAQIAEADQKLSALHQAEQDQQLTCRYGPTPSPDEVREKSLAQWDAAAGDSLADIAPDQEWEIRKALGREMGLAPSEVNGWRDIYERRAAEARRTLARNKEEEAEKEKRDLAARKAACEQLQATRTDIKAEQQRRDQLSHAS
jgi:hypothetical protein